MRRIQHPGKAAITLTGVLYALSDPARLDIVRSLRNGKERSCAEFGNHKKSTISHHLRVLRETGVTHTRTDGRQRFTSLREDDLDARFPGLLRAVLDAKDPL